MVNDTDVAITHQRSCIDDECLERCPVWEPLWLAVIAAEEDWRF